MAKLDMKIIDVRDAVGTVLCHDITRIVPGESKGPVFRKGHVVREEDIATLLDVGKEHLYVYAPCPGMVHENDAAARIAAAVCGPHLRLSEPKEGRINFSADCRGILEVDVSTLTAINSIGEITLATLHSMRLVEAGQDVAGTRVVPLRIEESRLRRLASPEALPAFLAFSRRSLGVRSLFLIKFCSFNSHHHLLKIGIKNTMPSFIQNL